jgi:hypothetical protein
VKGRDTSITEESIDFIKSSLGMDKAGARSLHAAQEFINRNIRDELGKLEKDLFSNCICHFCDGPLASTLDEVLLPPN